MKKLFVLLMVLAIASTVAFAEVKLSGDVDGMVGSVIGGEQTAVDNGTTTTTTDDGIKTGDVGGVTRITFSATNEEGTVGANGRLQLGRTGVDVGPTNVPTGATSGNVWVWWKPIEQFKLTLGPKVDAGYGGSWGHKYNLGFQNYAGGGGDIFNGFDQPILFELFPVAGLSIGINLKAEEWFADDTVVPPLHIAAKYDINGIGDIRFGFKGSQGTNPRIEAAFQLTAVENLNLQIGLKVPFGDKDLSTDKADTDPMSLAVRATFVAGDFDIWARVLAKFAGKDNGGDVDPVIGFSITPSYNLGALTAGVHFTLETQGDNDSGHINWQAGPALYVPYSGGHFDVGVRFGQTVTNAKPTKTSVFSWAIPISLAFGF